MTEDHECPQETHEAEAEWLQELLSLEEAGERTQVSVGPFSAFTIIASLQLATRHPEMSAAQRKIIQGFYRQFYPLFKGTVGEHLILQGEHPEWDVSRVSDDDCPGAV